MVDACARWALAVKAGAAPYWLTLVGRPGTGKTHCARRLFKFTASLPSFNPSSCDYVPSFVRWGALVDDLRNGDHFALVRDMAGWPFLFLDDIAAERDPTGFAADKLANLLCARGGRWTVLTSNASPAEFASLDARIASRLVRDGNKVVQVTAPDYALR